MFDIRWIRSNPDAFDRALESRGAEPQAARLLALDDARRAHVAKLQDAQERRNAASKEIGKAKGSGDNDRAQALIDEVAQIKAFIQGGEDEERALSAALDDAMAAIPNLPLDDVPVGADENDNVFYRAHGDKPELAFEAKEHFEIPGLQDGLDFETAAKLSGSRFVILKGQLAALERALGQFMINLHTVNHGYLEVSPPLLVRDDPLFGTSQLPKFSEDLFKTTDGRWLIPTAEVPLTNLVREEIADAEQRVSRCCPRGAAGVA